MRFALFVLAMVPNAKGPLRAFVPIHEFHLIALRGRSLSTYAVGGRGGVMKMQTEAYRGGGGGQ